MHDHAAGQISHDTALNFIHNTDFTDIFGTTGLDPENGYLRLQVYPNPAGDVLYIISEEPVVTLSLISVTGSRVKTTTNREASQALSLEGIASGIYFIEITTADQQTVVKRIMKK